MKLGLTNFGQYFRYFRKPDFSLPAGIFSQTRKNSLLPVWRVKVLS
jgi:hypothetical protein